MINFLQTIGLLVILINLVTAHDPSVQLKTCEKIAHISPEIINELKDFKNLIPEATIDEIVAKHLLLDGNFRTVLKYLRSEEFAQLQKQLLCVPEIIDVLQFLHLTAQNATTMHMGATKMPTTGKRVEASLDEYEKAAASALDTHKSMDKIMTNTNTGRKVIKPQTMASDDAKKVEEAVNNLRFPKRPQQPFYIKEQSNKIVGLDGHIIDDADDKDVDNDDDANSIALSEQQPLVDIVLLEDLEVKAKVSNERQQQQQYHKYTSYNNSVGTFLSFVEEVLQHLPNSAYQQMITDKCHNNTQFAQFYQALRSPIFKPYIEELKLKPNIQNIIKTLQAHEVDVNGLEAIASKVISWGPHP